MTDAVLLTKVIAALIALVVAVGVVSLLSDRTEQVDIPAHRRTAGFDPQTRLERHLWMGDGKFHVLVARDPLMRHPEWYPYPQAGYRTQRPLMGYAAWVASLGRPEKAPAALAVLSLFGVALGAWWFCVLLMRVGVDGMWGAAAVLAPGVFGGLIWFAPEPLGIGLLLAGVATGTIWPLALAGLVRESFLLVPLVLLIRTRNPRYAWPMVWFGVWAVVGRWGYGQWFFEVTSGTRPLGFLGLDVVKMPEPEAALWFAGAFFVLGFLAWRRGGLYGAIVGAYLLFALFLGDLVWNRWHDSMRVLSPAWFFGALALVSRPTGNPLKRPHGTAN